MTDDGFVAVASRPGNVAITASVMVSGPLVDLNERVESGTLVSSALRVQVREVSHIAGSFDGEIVLAPQHPIRFIDSSGTSYAYGADETRSAALSFPSSAGRFVLVLRNGDSGYVVQAVIPLRSDMVVLPSGQERSLNLFNQQVQIARSQRSGEATR